MDYKKNMVTKSNRLIMARYDLTVAEIRLILTLISLIQPNDEDFREYRIPVSDYLRAIGRDRSDGRAYELLDAVTDSLMSRVLARKTDNGFEKVNWLSYSKYDRNAGVLICSFDPHLKDDLLYLKREFTTYQLEYALRLGSKYALKLYEILKRFAHIGCWEITIDELKELLNIPKKYKWLNIRQRVLQPAIKELALTDIRFDYTAIKRGRRVAAVRFTITDTHQQALELGQPDEIPAPVSAPDAGAAPPADPPGVRQQPASDALDEADIDALLALVPGRSRRAVLRLIRQAVGEYGADYVRAKIELAAEAKIRRNYAGWLRRAIEDDYRPPEASDPAVRQREARERAEREMQERIARDQSLIDELTGQIVSPSGSDQRDQIVAIHPRPGGGYDVLLRPLAGGPSRIAPVRDLAGLRERINKF